MNKKILKYPLNFTLPIVILIAICSGIGVFYQSLYSKETTDWLAQCVGQDLSNLCIIMPALLVSAYFAAKGSKIAKIIWLGVMITNIYSYVIYCFAMHFNPLFHLYCAVLSLSIFSVIMFFYRNTDDFREWYANKVHTKTVGIFLIVIASVFVLMWLSDSLPYALSNTVPPDITKDALLTNPVHVLDFSFYLPTMYISAILLMKEKSLGYLLAPTMIIFGIITNINIIFLMLVSMNKMNINTIPQICIFGILTVICLIFLKMILKTLKGQRKYI